MVVRSARGPCSMLVGTAVRSQVARAEHAACTSARSLGSPAAMKQLLRCDFGCYTVRLGVCVWHRPAHRPWAHSGYSNLACRSSDTAHSAAAGRAPGMCTKLHTTCGDKHGGIRARWPAACCMYAQPLHARVWLPQQLPDANQRRRTHTTLMQRWTSIVYSGVNHRLAIAHIPWEEKQGSTSCCVQGRSSNST